MRAVADADHEPLERWAGMREAEVAVDVGRAPRRLAGRAARASSRARCRASAPCRPTARSGWTSGTLFPQASKKIARAINAASGRRPLVVLANLAGFDGSPESMRRLQLEYGAEIGRAIVNFDGPIVFCVISRFHGGAFVVFSRRLNDQLETIALEGAHASVIGGAPAAAVVFAREVDVRTREDERIARSTSASRRPRAPSASACARSATIAGPRSASEKLGELAARVRRHPQRPARGRGRLRRPHHPGRRAAAAADRRDRARDGQTPEERAGGNGSGTPVGQAS